VPSLKPRHPARLCYANWTPNQYCRVPAYVLDLISKVGYAQGVRVFVFMLAHTDSNRERGLALSFIQRGTGIDRSDVSRAIKELEAHEWIEQIDVGQGGGERRYAVNFKAMLREYRGYKKIAESDEPEQTEASAGKNATAAKGPEGWSSTESEEKIASESSRPLGVGKFPHGDEVGGRIGCAPEPGDEMEENAVGKIPNKTLSTEKTLGKSPTKIEVNRNDEEKRTKSYKLGVGNIPTKNNIYIEDDNIEKYNKYNIEKEANIISMFNKYNTTNKEIVNNLERSISNSKDLVGNNPTPTGEELSVGDIPPISSPPDSVRARAAGRHATRRNDEDEPADVQSSEMDSPEEREVSKEYALTPKYPHIKTMIELLVVDPDEYHRIVHQGIPVMNFYASAIEWKRMDPDLKKWIIGHNREEQAVLVRMIRDRIGEMRRQPVDTVVEETNRYVRELWADEKESGKMKRS